MIAGGEGQHGAALEAGLEEQDLTAKWGLVSCLIFPLNLHISRQSSPAAVNNFRDHSMTATMEVTTAQASLESSSS